jgi:serpin B
MTARISAAILSASIALLVGIPSFGFDASTVRGAVKASNAFGFDFYLQARRGQTNFVCSPAGTTIALTMAVAGAQGETRAEMLQALHIDPENSEAAYASFAALLAALQERGRTDGLALDVATRLWIQKHLEPRPTYLSLLRDVFHTPLSEADFESGGKATVAAINQWASDATHGRVPHLLAGLSGADTIVVTNVASMTGQWLRPFDHRAAYDAKFAAPSQRTAVKVKMLKGRGGFRYAQVDGAKLIELRYLGELSMVVVLPDYSDGLEKVENRLASRYDEWVEALEPQDVDLELPRFATTTALPLVDLLKAMGIRRAFDDRQANFSDMVSASVTEAGRRNPSIGHAIQKASIETPAPLVIPYRRTRPTVDPLEGLGPLPPPQRMTFHANHPFIYVVRDVKSGQIVFLGRIVKPGI